MISDNEAIDMIIALDAACVANDKDKKWATDKEWAVCVLNQLFTNPCLRATP